MIAFDLSCDQDHTCEAWFQDSKAFDLQKEKGLLECPVCGSTHVRKLVSAVNVRNMHLTEGDNCEASLEKLLVKTYQFLKKHTEDVGPAFAQEALKIHYGVSERRNIRGVATPEEEDTLRNEGILFMKLPVPVKGPSEDN
jgi:hypothetical protein